MKHQPTQEQGPRYQFKVESHLNPAWTEWFEGEWFEEMTLTHESDGSTLLTGRVEDQAALHGLLVKIRDLGLTLISVARVDEVGDSERA